MKSSDGKTGQCPDPTCKGKVSYDRKNRGFVRHLHRKPDGTKCPYGKGQRD